jgi:holo-[acyl-carrier protein] synthase
VASAVAITEDARPRKDDKPDPRAQLAASFKEARALLDEVETAESVALGETGADAPSEPGTDTE